MRKIFGLGLMAATFALSNPAQAAVAISGPDTAPDGSFTIGFSGSNVAQPSFSESFSFTTAVSGFLSGIISTTGGGSNAVNDVDFTRVFFTGTGLGTGTDFSPLAGSTDANEVRSLSDIAVQAGTYSLFTQGTSTGSNGSYGGNVSFRAAALVPAVPEPATWAMMLLGFSMVGGVARYRRRRTNVAYA